MDILILGQVIGLILGIIGTYLLIFSTKIITNKGIRFEGIPATITQINQKKFRGGLILMLIGFSLQVIPLIFQFITSF